MSLRCRTRSRPPSRRGCAARSTGGPGPASRPAGAALERRSLRALVKGRALLFQRGRFILQAIPCLERAIALDPAYAEAMGWLADAYRLLGTFGAAPAAEVMPRAKAMAERALAIDPDLVEARATLATVEAQYERTYSRATESWARAIELDPRHSRSRCERAMWSLGLGARPAEWAVEECRRVALDDPLNAWIAAVHSFLLGLAGRHAEAIAEGERAVGIDADSFIAQWMLLEACIGAGEYPRALGMIPAMLAASGRHTWVLASLALVRARTGQEAAARAVYDELEARSRFEFVSPFWLATAASAAGLADAAIGYARRAMSERDPMLILARWLPHCGGLLADERFAELTRGVWE